MSEPRGRRLAVVKPDFGVTGGFEAVVDRLETILGDDGHDVQRLVVDLTGLPRRVHGLAVPDRVWDQAPEYFRYLASMEACAAVDVSGFDAVISTQPPSFAVRHPRHLSIFYHHHRIFYDLSEPYVAAGFADDVTVHRRAEHHVRALDRPHLAAVTHFLAGSEVVRERLERFNDLTGVGVLHAGLGSFAGETTATGGPAEGAVLCVTRLEFPKRAELFVQALAHLPHRRGALVGAGGRLGWVRALAARLAAGTGPASLDDRDLWLNTGLGAPPVAEGAPLGNTALLGRVDEPTLARLYREAPCVVAPAFDEDYGLTAIEAMAHGVPVVTCADGGGLTTLVDHGVDGLVVEPTGAAIAEAVESVLGDPARARAMGEAGRAKAATLTWDRAAEELRAGLAVVLDQQA